MTHFMQNNAHPLPPLPQPPPPPPQQFMLPTLATMIPLPPHTPVQDVASIPPTLPNMQLNDDGDEDLEEGDATPGAD